MNLVGFSSPLHPWFCLVLKGVGDEAGFSVETHTHTPIVICLASHILGSPTPLDARQLYRPVSSLATDLNSCGREKPTNKPLLLERARFKVKCLLSWRVLEEESGMLPCIKPKSNSAEASLCLHDTTVCNICLVFFICMHTHLFVSPELLCASWLDRLRWHDGAGSLAGCPCTRSKWQVGCCAGPCSSAVPLSQSLLSWGFHRVGFEAALKERAEKSHQCKQKNIPIFKIVWMFLLQQIPISVSGT